MKATILTLILLTNIHVFSQKEQLTPEPGMEMKTDAKTFEVRSKNKQRLMKAFSIVNDSTIESSDSTIGLVEVKDDRIDLLIQDYVENKKIVGHRIQIFSTNTRSEASKIRTEFLKKYPKEKSYLIYQAPNFKVRVGDYTNRLVAHEYLELIKIDFPAAFIVKDKIEIRLD